jgi:uncharacterized membrane protein
VNTRVAHLAASLSLVALIALCVAWELWLAPLRPGGSWLVLKVLPLLLPVFGIFRGKAYTFKWTSLLVWIYFAEGVVRAMSDARPSSLLAGAEVALSLALFGSVVAYLRSVRMA